MRYPAGRVPQPSSTSLQTPAKHHGRSSRPRPRFPRTPLSPIAPYRCANAARRNRVLGRMRLPRFRRRPKGQTCSGGAKANAALWQSHVLGRAGPDLPIQVFLCQYFFLCTLVTAFFKEALITMFWAIRHRLCDFLAPLEVQPRKSRSGNV